jgi:hypothetical protein
MTGRNSAQLVDAHPAVATLISIAASFRLAGINSLAGIIKRVPPAIRIFGVAR